MTSTTPTPTTEQTISQIQIRAHIPVILDMGKINYDNWRILFETHCHSFSILGHLDGTSTPTGPTDKTWHQIDGSIKMWIYGTISESLLSSVLKPQCTARELWENLENLFRDNKEARAIQLENELRSFTIGDLSVHDYCQKLKSISDLLTNVNSPISDRTLVMHLLNGLSSKFDSIINVIKHQKPPCSFINARSMLILEEDRLKTKRRPEPSNTDNASSPQVLIATAPQHVDNRSSSTTPHYNSRGGRSYRGGRGGRSNRGGRGNQNWQSGNWNFGNQNPWAWPSQPQWPNNSPWPNQQQWPNTSPWPNQAWQHTGHQSRFSTATHPPFSSPSQGLLGHAPASAGSAYLSTTTTPSPANSEFIPTTLANAFNTMTLTDPSDAGWYMDTGATAHLTSQPVAALMSVKNKMKDETEVLSGWDINSVDPCTWNMVGCSSSEGFVVSLEMASKGLSGTISTSIGELTHFHTLLLQNNQLTGPIPSELGQLSELETLDLSGNQFSGQIPASLGFLTHLNYLRLSRNQLSGQIPHLVAGLSGLSFLDLSFNNLSGPTPNILAKDYRIVGNAFLCGPASQELCSDATPVRNVTGLSEQDNSKHHSLMLSFAFGIVVAFIISLMFLFFWVLWHRSHLSRSYVQQDYEFEIGHLKRFSFREIQTATSNFSPKNILGQGGFGMVYKGYLPNGTVVAVKRLKDPNYTGEVQFQTEVEMIGLAVHRNLLRLFGFCMTSEERMLVYPYMPNGSVADRLRDSYGEKPSLDWNRRISIALGAARGLVYLHEQCNPKIIHRDVKAANILLDESFEAIVGDFGLAKLLDQRDSHVTTAVRGTIGHIAPEYLSTGQSSEKTDVFGFGVLILELITGHKMIDQGNGQVRKGMILSWVRTLKAEKRFAEMVDRDLKGEFDDLVLEEVVELALLCTQPHPNLRPRMSQVLKVLEGLVEQCEGGYEARGPSVSRNYSNGHEEHSFIIEPIELSGPR